MTDDNRVIVPLRLLATGDVQVPAEIMDKSMTAEGLTEWRSALAVLADQPIATLEMYPLPDKVDLRRGIPLDATSPLAQHLSQLISQTVRSPSVPESGEALYRMVVPAKVAAEFSRGIVGPMASKAAAGGIYSALRDSKGIVAMATFVPVGEATAAVGDAGAGAGGALAGGAVASGAVAGGAVAGGVAFTVAAPLLLMAVAVGASAAAEHQRQQAIDHITELLEQLYEQKLDEDRSELDGCRDAIEMATAILLDEGKLGVSLGLDSAVHAIGKALAAAERRLARWQNALDNLPDAKAVDVEVLMESFPGIESEGGTFRGHLELANLAVALKRRVIVLQAVEHAQSEPDNQFENFTHALNADQQRLDKLEADIASVLLRLSTLELARPRGLHSPVVTSSEVDRLLRTAYRIHALGDGIAINSRPSDVAIEIARKGDGSVVVLPALAA